MMEKNKWTGFRVKLELLASGSVDDEYEYIILLHYLL
jgi:hypothetical protein